MQESDALALVAVLEAAFPRWNGGETTTRLFATKLRAYDAASAAKGIDALVNRREDTTWPSWAEVARWIREATPRPAELGEADPDPVPGMAAKAWQLVQRTAGKQLPRIHESQALVEARIQRARDELERIYSEEAAP